MHAHLVENVADRGECATHMVWIQPPDTADAEGIGDREFAGIDDVSAIFQLVVKGLEYEILVPRHAEGDDDRRLQMIRQQRLKAERAHAVDQDSAILHITPATPRNAAFGVELIQRLMLSLIHISEPTRQA